MTRVTHRADLRVWLVLSLVLHTFLLALPGRLIETVFPARPEVVCGMPADLTPDFEDIAISVIRMSREPSPAPVEARIAEDVDPDMGPQPPQLPAATPVLRSAGDTATPTPAWTPASSLRSRA